MYRILYPQQRILCPSGPIVPRFRNPILRPLPYSARLQRHALFRTTFFSGPLEFNQFECLANCTALGRVEWKNILKCASAFLVNTNSFLKKKKKKTRNKKHSTKFCLTLATTWTVACQAPLSMGFSRQEYWSGLPFPSPRELPDPKNWTQSLALQADALPTKLHRNPNAN